MADLLVVDAASGLIGQRTFEDLVDGAIHFAQQTGSAVSLLVVDLAGPTHVTPRAVGDLLCSIVRSTDVISRLDDGTFGLLVDGPGSSGQCVGTRVRLALQAAFPSTAVWAGLASTGGGGCRPATLLAAATLAAGRARRSGGGLVESAARIGGLEGPFDGLAVVPTLLVADLVVASGRGPVDGPLGSPTS